MNPHDSPIIQIKEVCSRALVAVGTALRECDSALQHLQEINWKLRSSVKAEVESQRFNNHPQIIHLKRLLDLSANEIEFSVRTANLINNNNVMTIGDLVLYSAAEIRKWHQCGAKTVTEIETGLAKLGLKLRHP